MALKQIKNKIISTKKTGKVTKAMEAVSAVKMRKTQQQALRSRSYVRTALGILEQLAASREAVGHPLMRGNENGKTLAVVITSDKGLAGSVNSAVLKLAEQTRMNESGIEMIAVGRKAVEFATRNSIARLREYTNIGDEVVITDVRDMTDAVVSAFLTGEYRRVVVIYQNFISTFEQRPELRTVLPLDAREVEETLRGIRPASGKWSDAETASASVRSYTFEPSPEAVLEALIPQLVQILLYHALVESKACEHSARMVAMKNATDKTKEITKYLTLLFNKERQAAITAEVSEITGGLEVMKS